ncbi:hypothetical protein DSECCO2_621020 [anaerobic digester metagenome]
MYRFLIVIQSVAVRIGVEGVRGEAIDAQVLQEFLEVAESIAIGIHNTIRRG